MPALKHKVLITTSIAGASTQDDDTGALTENSAKSPRVIYDGKGFFLDQGVAVEREAGTGVPTLMADGQVVLPRKSVEKWRIQDGMAMTIIYPNGDEVDMNILKAIRFTDICYVNRA